MYHFVCHDCEEEETFRELDPAQSAFNDHARQDHEAVLRRIGPTPTEPAPGVGNGGAVDRDRVD